MLFVCGLDVYWIEKMVGNKEMMLVEFFGDIYMLNLLFILFMILFGMFIVGIGFLY